MVFPEYLCDRLRGTVPPADPNHLGRKSKQQATLIRVRVFRNNHELVLAREDPYRVVIGGLHPDHTDVQRTRIQGGQSLDESVRDVLVKEQFHAGIAIGLGSRPAANARQARMSSLVRSGKSWRIWSSVMPEAR